MELSGMKKMIKKAISKEPDPSEIQNRPMVEIFYNYENYDAIYDLIRELMNDGKLPDLRNTIYLNCKLVDEKDHLYVYAAKSGRGNKYRCIGSVYDRDREGVLKDDIYLVRSKKYFWSLSLYYSFVTGAKFGMVLRESKFSK